jgi:O-antigen/teichoic acid export membrane protein
LLPLYTAFLTPDDYGIFNVVISISSLLSVFFLLSLHGAASRFHYYYLNDDQQIKKTWGTLCSFVIINSVFLGVFFIILNRFLLIPFVKGIDFYPYLFLGIINTILTPLYLFFQTYLQTKQDGVRFGINLLLNFLLHIGLALFFIVGLKKGVLGLLLANVITSIVFFIYVLFSFIPKIIIGLDKNILKPALKYSVPLIPHSLSSWLMSMVDRIFVNNITGKWETGLYSVGYQFGNIVNVLTNAVNQAYVPWFFEKEKKGEFQQVVKIAELVTLLYCFIALGISLYAMDVLKIMVSDIFRTAWRFIPFISFAYVFNGLYFFYINVLFLKQTKWVPFVTFCSAATGLLLNILLIPVVGSIGASISCLITFFVSSILALILSIKLETIRFNYFRMYFYSFLFFIFSLIIFIPIHIDSFIFFLAKTCFCLFLIIFFGFFYRKDIFLLKTIIYHN